MAPNDSVPRQHLPHNNSPDYPFGIDRQDQQAVNHDQQSSGSKSWREQFASLNGMSWVVVLTLASVFLLPMAVDAIFALALLLAMWNRPGTADDLRHLCRDPLLWSVAALLLYLGITVFFAPQADWANVSQVWMRGIFIALFILAGAILFRELPGFESRLCRIVTLSALAAAIIAIVCFYLETPLPYRLTGLFRLNNEGRAGRMFCAALPFIFFILLTDRTHWRTAAICALPAAVVAMLLTDTRSAWLAAVLVVLVYGLAMLRQPPVRFVLLLLLCCVLGSALLVAWVVGSADATEAVFPRGDSFRLGIWSGHLRDIFAGNPWYGWSQLTDHWVEVEGTRFRGPHNMYIAVLSHIGIPGLLLFATVLGWTGIRLLTRLELSYARLGLSLLIAGAAMFVFNGDRLIDKVGLVWFVLWLPVGIALAGSVPRRGNSAA